MGQKKEEEEEAFASLRLKIDKSAVLSRDK